MWFYAGSSIILLIRFYAGSEAGFMQDRTQSQVLNGHGQAHSEHSYITVVNELHALRMCSCEEDINLHPR